MNVEELLQGSRAIRQDAGAILQAFEVVNQLEQYGQVEVVGAYRWGTMVDPDIDLHVVNPKADLEMALEAHVALIRQGNFYAHYFGDWVNFSRDGFPRGHYIGLKRIFNGRKWKVDIWLLRAPDTDSDWIGERMTEEGRHAILAFKHLRKMRNLNVSSYDIYRMALIEGVTDPNCFLKLV